MSSPSEPDALQRDEPQPGYTHLVATRDGLFLSHSSGVLKILEGRFFGVTLAGGRVYAFEKLGPRGTDQGRIVSFALEHDAVVDHRTMADGLDAGCHQIDVFQDALLVIDTDNQRLVSFDRNWNRRFHHPLPTCRNEHPDHRHFNSLLGRGNTLHLMLHNKNQRPSERLEVDLAFREVSRVALPGRMCHDLVRTPDGGWIMCDSLGGQLIDAQGPLVKVDELVTRGLAVGETDIAVGSSLFGPGPVRDLFPGFVTFMDRRYRRTGRLHLPAAPTQIRRLAGPDYSLSWPREWP